VSATTPAPASRRYARFLAGSSAIVAGLCVLGYVPTERLAGPSAVTAMIAGCAIGLLSAAAAGCLLVVVNAETPMARMQRGGLAMIVRLVVVLVLGLAAALSGEFARSPLLFWMATTYVVLLPLEVRLALL